MFRTLQTKIQIKSEKIITKIRKKHDENPEKITKHDKTLFVLKSFYWHFYRRYHISMIKPDGEISASMHLRMRIGICSRDLSSSGGKKQLGRNQKRNCVARDLISYHVYEQCKVIPHLILEKKEKEESLVPFW